MTPNGPRCPFAFDDDTRTRLLEIFDNDATLVDKAQQCIREYHEERVHLNDLPSLQDDLGRLKRDAGALSRLVAKLAKNPLVWPNLEPSLTFKAKSNARGLADVLAEPPVFSLDGFQLNLLELAARAQRLSEAWKRSVGPGKKVSEAFAIERLALLFLDCYKGRNRGRVKKLTNFIALCVEKGQINVATAALRRFYIEPLVRQYKVDPHSLYLILARIS